MKNILYLDIETFGNEPERVEPTLPTRDDVKVGNLKDPAKIEAKIEEALPIMRAEAIAKAHEDHQKEWRGNALKSVRGKIICISFAFNDDPVINLSIDDLDKEQDMMRAFEEVIKDIAPAHLQTYVVAHNGMAFDFPWLRHRAIKYALKHLYELLTFSRYDPRAHDTQDLFRGSDYRNYYSMDSVAEFLGFEGKKGMTGADVHDEFLNNNIAGIADYCNNDVEVLRNVYKQITKLDA